MTIAPNDDRSPARTPTLLAAAAGLAAGAAALGAAELTAGLVPGVASPVIAIGDAIIALQPPGAKQFVVDLVGEADKLLLTVLVTVVALAAAAGLGVVGRGRPGVARAGFAAFGLLYLAAGLADPLAEALPTLLAVVVAVVVAIAALAWLMRLAWSRQEPPVAEMPAWERRRFLGASLGVIGLAVGGGVLGRAFLEGGRPGARQPARAIPPPAATAPPLLDGAALDVAGITPIVTPNDAFYRIDTALIVPRPDVATWSLRVHGMVDRPFELSYDELLAMPIEEQHVTIACVSNEVGGGLVGNALWSGVPLRRLLERAGVREGATQIVGRSVDGFTAGFPTSWALEAGREALVAVAMNGEPLPPRHGYPARLIVPGLYGYVSATKWLSEIELTTLEGFDAYWVPLGWAKEAPILTQSRIDVPRHGASVPAGSMAVAGVAWAPDRGVSAVEVRVDDGAWERAELSTPISDATWVQFVRRWEATPGRHVLSVRATDGDGVVQTDRRTRPAPDGARGHHTIDVSVT